MVLGRLSAVVIVIILRAASAAGATPAGLGRCGIPLTAHEVNQLGDFLRSISRCFCLLFRRILLSIASGLCGNRCPWARAAFFWSTASAARVSVWSLAFRAELLNVVKATFLQVLIFALWSLLLIVQASSVLPYASSPTSWRKIRLVVAARAGPQPQHDDAAV
jgi:hypothetical protein